MRKHVLTIAGFDPCGGAGLQADLKTMQAFGVYGLSVATALTVQNTQGVTAVKVLEPDWLLLQCQQLLADIRVDAIKIGMLGNAAMVRAVADVIESVDCPVVLDPVLWASSGMALLSEAKSAILALLARVDFVTPNVPEAEALTGVGIKNDVQRLSAARVLQGYGVANVVIKGGHALYDQEQASDLYLGPDASARHYELPRLQNRSIHGSGCIFSSALASGLALGYTPDHAIEMAKRYVWQCLDQAYALGQGQLQAWHTTLVN